MRSFSIIGQVREIETIAAGHGIRELAVLNRRFGKGRWRKMKGVAEVKFDDGTIATAELHWYEAHGLGKRKMRVKYLLD